MQTSRPAAKGGSGRWLGPLKPNNLIIESAVALKPFLTAVIDGRVTRGSSAARVTLRCRAAASKARRALRSSRDLP